MFPGYFKLQNIENIFYPENQRLLGFSVYNLHNTKNEFCCERFTATVQKSWYHDTYDFSDIAIWYF